MGGKRYLSGYIDWTPEEWQEHFGDQWEPFCALKRKYDPGSVLNPGFVPFPRTETPEAAAATPRRGATRRTGAKGAARTKGART
jgi:hypothetical protein